MTMTADPFIEIAVTGKSGSAHSARFAFSAELTYPQIFAAAHQNVDGSTPTLVQLGGDAVMLDHVRRLRAVEDELHRRASEDESPFDPSEVVVDVRCCARCGGDHDQVRFQRMARAFAPPEAAPIVWQHWAPCPTNGDPIMQAKQQ
jgi:hypothetical protein